MVAGLGRKLIEGDHSTTPLVLQVGWFAMSKCQSVLIIS
ncbi:hypothetical protein Krac_0555 [Ktedonobacter racemifer DSM 44963]|uniref:Uncharacterized protein n=1 Tax=Ktedonobacter racemifer DSM 44963 TaxID=485913 RepID=D6U806_KTERA|nr:hypothetical protein Krac_0555 [Ktedonobacter racemifer DSM 44963]